MNDLDLDGNWSWDSGEVFDWTDWAPGEPNGNWEDENVAVMNWGVDVDGSTVYGWNDWKDQNRFAQALIEVVVPAPGVLAVLGLASLWMLSGYVGSAAEEPHPEATAEQSELITLPK